MEIESGREQRILGLSAKVGRRCRILFLLLALLGAGIAVALLLASPSIAVQHGGVWQQINTPSTPGNLDGHSLVTIDNDVYLFGGHDADDDGLPWQDNIYVHGGGDLSTGWRKIDLPSPRPPGRANHAAAAVDGKMVVHGGMNGSGVLGDTWVYDPQTMTWSQKTTASTPPGLVYHSAVASGGKIYIIGGTDSSGQPSAEVWAYDLPANSWTQRASYPGPFGGAYGAAVFAPDSIVMVAGTTGNDYYVYDPATNTWTPKMTPSGFPSRISPGTAQVGDYGYIFGGEDYATGRYRTDVWKADLKQDPVQWEPQPPNCPNHKAPVVLIPEAHSPTTPGWAYTFGNVDGEPGALLYGRSWMYDPASSIPIPILGDAATFIFWPNASSSGALAGLSVLPDTAILPAGEQQLFNAYGRDADGYYVPVTPTWGAAGGYITDLGLYTAGDWPGTYYVAAAANLLRAEASVTVTGTEVCPDLAPGSTWSHTFGYAGSYPYHDRANPNISGTVMVNSALAALNSADATWVVSITAAGFDPPVVVIGLNDTVYWINDDTATHAVGGGTYRQYHFVYLPLVLR